MSYGRWDLPDRKWWRFLISQLWWLWCALLALWLAANWTHLKSDHWKNYFQSFITLINFITAYNFRQQTDSATRTDTGNLSYKMQQPFIMQFRYLTYSDLLFHLNILLIFKVVFPLYYWFRNTIAWNFKNMGKIKYFLILLLSIIVFVRCTVKQIKLYLQVWLNHLWENE